MTINPTELRTIVNRVEAHINDIEGRAAQGDKTQFALRPGQIGLARDFVEAFREKDAGGKPKTSGYFVRPTGTGKTVSLIDLIIGANTLPSGKSVLGDPNKKKRSIVMVPQNFLLDQWENELLGELQENGTRKPSKWGDNIKPEDVGIYRASDTFKQKCEALQKSIVVITYDSARIITSGYNSDDVEKETEENRKTFKKMLNPESFSLTVLDEVHDRPRGDVTGQFIKDHFMGNSLVVGATATHLYKSGKTIGDYLFGGQIPFHETTFREAVNNKEICPMRNIIAEVELDEKQGKELGEITQAALERAKKNGAKADEIDYTEQELERIVQISQRDEAAIRLLQRGFDPDTGKKYKDMKQVWYCASVKHAKKLAAQLNEEMGDENYARAVFGEMNGTEQSAILLNYKQGKHKAVLNKQLLTLGFDDAEAELCVQIAPTRSPNRAMQQGGRVMRLNKNNPKKIANIITFVYPGIQQVIFGELAQGMILIPEGYEFTAAESQTSGESVRAWPEIEGLKVHYTTEQLTLFAEKRNKEKFVNGLPKKTDEKLTVEEMAREMFPNASEEKLSKETARLQRRVYEPLQAAYDMREARQKFVGMPSSDNTEEIGAFGQKFPVWRIGHYSEDKKARFCLDKELATVCRLSMYGRVSDRTAGLLSDAQAKRLLGLNDQQWNETIDQIKEAFLDRKAYERTMRIGSVTMPHEWVGYYRDNGKVDFHLQPDALLPIYQMAKDVSAEEAKQWWNRHTVLPKLKTTEWLNKDDVMEELGIGTLSGNKDDFDKIWGKIEAAHKRGTGKDGAARDIKVALSGHTKSSLSTATKTTLPDDKHTCLHKDLLHVLQNAMGMESGQDAASAAIRKR
jgi:superfamily II DNA or RNA helicase